MVDCLKFLMKLSILTLAVSVLGFHQTSSRRIPSSASIRRTNRNRDQVFPTNQGVSNYDTDFDQLEYGSVPSPKTDEEYPNGIIYEYSMEPPSPKKFKLKPRKRLSSMAKGCKKRAGRACKRIRGKDVHPPRPEDPDFDDPLGPIDWGPGKQSAETLTDMSKHDTTMFPKRVAYPPRPKDPDFEDPLGPIDHGTGKLAGTTLTELRDNVNVLPKKLAPAVPCKPCPKNGQTIDGDVFFDCCQ